MFSIEALLVYLNQDDVLYVSNTTVQHESENELAPHELAALTAQQGFVFQDLLLYSSGHLNPCPVLQPVPLPNEKKSLIVIFKKKTHRFTRKSKSRPNQSLLLPLQLLP